MKKNILLKSFAIFLLVSIAFAFNAPDRNGKGGSLIKESNKAGDSYRLFINNIDMPMNRQGVMADVSIAGRDGGRLDGNVFLFSGGFFMSGKTNGKVWANAVASASRIQDYNQGTYASGVNDPRAQIYVVRQKDGDFAQSWLDWKDAVALGAEFYDGDADGTYNPVDKNGNGKWDSDSEDRPDLIGDETVWCVYSDKVDPALRRFNDIDPQGIEVRQTVFAFASKGITGNLMFLRYNIVNTGLVADVIDSVYFGVWADPDLGEPLDDLVGCDTTLNSGYVYNDGGDPVFGSAPPCFLIDFFQGPHSYIPGVTFVDANNNGLFDAGETALDTAHNVRGKVRGIENIPGATNLGLSSFVHYQQSDPFLGDPNFASEARNYMLGTAKLGDKLDPCTWTLGVVVGGVNCATIDNRFWYSGDPVARRGWLNSTPTDQRQMSNTGPFKLIKGIPVNIVVAYVVGRGTDALSSITEAKKNDITAQAIFDANFPSLPAPPAIPYTVKTGEGFIDIDIQTSKMLNYSAVDPIFQVDRFVEGLYITAYKSNVTSDIVNGQVNSKIIARYDRLNNIDSIYYIVPNGGIDMRMPSSDSKLDSNIYKDPATGRLKFRMETDPFTGGPLIKGHEYYFTLTQYTANVNGLFNYTPDTRTIGTVKPKDTTATGTVVYGPKGPYIDVTATAVEEFADLEPLEKKYASSTRLITVIMGMDIYAPSLAGQTAKKSEGATTGSVKYVVVDNSKLTGNTYNVQFYSDTNPNDGPYLPYWSLSNATTGAKLIDSSRVYDSDLTNYSGQVIQGFIPKITRIIPDVTPSASLPYFRGSTAITETNNWFNRLTAVNNRGLFVPVKDIATPSSFTPISGGLSTITTADKLRRVEIRFGTSGKAYRYLNGYVGSAITSQTNYIYAGAITDTVRNPGGWLGKPGQGYVDVPFTAWVKDDAYGEERQLAVGFVEKKLAADPKVSGMPDGVWNPLDSIARTKEVIIVFDAPYDPAGNQLEYKGSGVINPTALASGWANVGAGYVLNDPAATPEQKRIAASPWFNAMYVLALDRKAGAFYGPDEKLVIPLTAYPYTGKDKFTFTTKPGGNLTEAESKELWNKVNVFPNPLYGHNPQTSYNSGNPDEPFVTFSNLPEQVTISIFTLSGTKVRTLGTDDKSTPTAPFLRWNLKNESDLRVASGMYLAIVSSPVYGEKVLKFAIVMPQKQIKNY